MSARLAPWLQPFAIVHCGQGALLCLLTWPQDLFWPMEWGRSESVPVSSPEFKSPCRFPLALELCFCHENDMSALACWFLRRMRGTCSRALPKPRPDKPTPSWSVDLGDIINHNCSEPLRRGVVCYVALTNWCIIKSLSGRFGLWDGLVRVCLITYFLMWYNNTMLLNIIFKRFLIEIDWLLHQMALNSYREKFPSLPEPQFMHL